MANELDKELKRALLKVYKKIKPQEKPNSSGSSGSGGGGNAASKSMGQNPSSLSANASNVKGISNLTSGKSGSVNNGAKNKSANSSHNNKREQASDTYSQKEYSKSDESQKSNVQNQAQNYKIEETKAAQSPKTDESKETHKTEVSKTTQSPNQKEPNHKAVIKTNYSKSAKVGARAAASIGYGASHGNNKEASSKSKNSSANNANKGAHAKSAESYQNRDGAQSQAQKIEKQALEQERGEKYSNTYNADGERMTKAEFKAYQKELLNSNINGMRRIIISPDPEFKLTPNEMVSITRDAMQAWREISSKEFSFTYAVHDGQSELHSHVTMTAKEANAINMKSIQLESFKAIVDNAVQTQLDLRQEFMQSYTQELNANLASETIKTQTDDLAKFEDLANAQSDEKSENLTNAAHNEPQNINNEANNLSTDENIASDTAESLTENESIALVL